ncbi:hypothetical protein [Gordonia hankookensis]|uniref:Uncharacterized protein n=1 Tax=Gordonia hankookensis TaxID=589403 RepID=A0ABR7WFB9_9ACTN|nr:hypothetical protein [Gordonia hankookensis]MBD1320567.1 hypothetical protein [Gordonia hankookensis]
MSTLTMQAIAELAQVKRPVVSMWRSRFAMSDTPFPAPMGGNPLLFDAGQVAAWLDETGHGNNTESRFEASLHSSLFQKLVDNIDAASTLLLLHELVGEPIAGLHPAEAAAALETRAEVSSVANSADAVIALADSALVSAVDELAEAGFSGCRVLDILVADFVKPGGPWANEALTSDGRDLLASVIAEIRRAQPLTIVPTGTGGQILAHALVDQLDEDERCDFSIRTSTFDQPCDRAAWRRLVADGWPANAIDNPGELLDDQQGRLHLMMMQNLRSDSGFFDSVENGLLDLGVDDVLLVVGPARLMVDADGAPRRQKLLVPASSYIAPLRYVARLPKGLSRFGGRRRLALWIFGRPDSSWTVVGAHSDTRMDIAACEAIAADAATAISPTADLHAHAFHSSVVRASSYIVRRPTLTVPVRVNAADESGERLARVWELDRGMLDGISLTAASEEPKQVGFTVATRELGRDLAGSRIPREHVGEAQPGWAHVVGPDEVRSPTHIGSIGIDRLVLESVAPRARLTEPGDVIYVSAGGPAAVIDHHGGHVVLAPARAFRCRDAEVDDRQLVPAVVAADIAAQQGTDRRTWQLRTVHVEEVAPLEELIRRTDQRRQQLLDQLNNVEELRTEIIDGLSERSLTTQQNL